jgi:hypothetical protein
MQGHATLRIVPYTPVKIPSGCPIRDTVSARIRPAQNERVTLAT